MYKERFEKIDDGTHFLKSNPALYEATLDCFSSRSFESASLNDILKASGFNKGRFYYRYPDKKSLYFALLDDLFLCQEIVFSNQRERLVELRGLRGWTEAVFQNSLLLAREDPRFLRLLERAYGEDPEFVAELRTACVTSLHDRFRDFVVREAGTRWTFLPDLLGTLHLRLPAVLGTEFDETGIARLVNGLFEGIEGEASDSVGAFPAPASHSSEPETGLRMESGEILALAGSLADRNALLKNLLETDPFAQRVAIGRLPGRSASLGGAETEGIAFLQSLPLSARLSLRQNVRQILRRNPRTSEAEAEELLGILSLLPVADRRVSSLSPLERRKADFLPVILAMPGILVAEDPLEDIPEAERGELFNLLLKCRAGGSTIILSTSRMAEILAVADRVAFLREGRLLTVPNVRDLQQKYRGKWILVEYSEGNLKHRAAFPESRFASPEFLDLLSTKKLLSVQTKENLDEEIFQLETGVEIG